ncbi:MAG: ABC transporter permease [Chloroflexi bacterium]|nr:ABC transporter permease [Chloroflexota bacterium]
MTTGTTAAGAARTVLAPSPAARPNRLSAWLAAWLPALPLLVLVAAMLLAPAVLLILQSFIVGGSLSLDNWVRVLSSPLDQTAILNSLLLGAVSASISTLVGTPLAWLISRMLPVRRAGWLALLNVAANIGGIGLAFAYLATLGTVGMVTLALQGLGTDLVPPRPSSFLGLVLGYQYTNIPLFVLLTIPAMGALRDDWWEAAQTASATRSQFWRRIGLPILSPFIAAGWLLIFTWSIGIYGIAFALAGSGAVISTPLITLRIGLILQSDLFNTFRASVFAVILMIIASAALLAYRTLLRRALRWF